MGSQEAEVFRTSAQVVIPTVKLPDKIINSWQDIADIAADILRVPSCLITQVKGPDIDILISSRGRGSPYIVGESLLLTSDVYSNYVVNNRTELMISDAREEPSWANNTDIQDYGMVAYFGLPLFWPNGDIFGTFCVLDRRKKVFEPAHLQMLETFQGSIMKDLTLECLDSSIGPNNQQEPEQIYAHRVRELEKDLSKRIDKERQLKKALAEEHKASRNKSDFMTNMSLELLSPLNAIIGFSELIKNEAHGPLGKSCYKDYARDILNSGQHLLSVINDVLDVSKLETGEIQLRETECDLINLSASCLRMVTSRATEKGVTLSDLSQNPLPLLYADPVRLKQILNNLLTNAVKFTPDQGSITICTHISDHGNMIVEVSDTGAGIAPEKIKEVMQPFNQMAAKNINMHQDENSTQAQDSTGLGLSIVKSMMGLHNGTIELVSSLGVGTTVLLTFPTERVLNRNQP